MYNDLFTVFGVTIHGYGLAIAVGFLIAVFLSSYRAKRLGLDDDTVMSLALIAIIAGFIGAKLLYVIVHNKEFFADPIGTIGSEGFVAYGGIIVGALGVWWYCRHKKLDFLAYFDLLMPEVAIAQGFGRIGCFLAGCCYGRPWDGPLAVVFPPNCGAPAGIPLFPAQLFSAGGDILIGIVLLALHKKLRHRGTVGAMYLLLYGVGRFIIEFFRSDPRGNVAFLSTSQFISVFIVIIAVVMLAKWRKNDERADAPLPETAEEEAPEEAPEE